MIEVAYLSLIYTDIMLDFWKDGIAPTSPIYIEVRYLQPWL